MEAIRSGARRARRAGHAGVEQLAVLVVALVALGGVARWGAATERAIAGEVHAGAADVGAAEVAPSAVALDRARPGFGGGGAPHTSFANAMAGIVSAAERLANAADLADAARPTERIVEGLGVNTPRRPHVFRDHGRYTLVDRLPAPGSAEWRAYVANTRAGLARHVGQGYVVLPTAERLPGSLGRELIERYEPGFRAWTNDLALADRHAIGFQAYIRWLTKLLDEALGPRDRVQYSQRAGELRVGGPGNATRENRWHVDGARVRVGLTLEGAGTDFFPVSPFLRTEDWNRTFLLSETREAQLRAHGYRPVRAKRGDIVIFRGRGVEAEAQKSVEPGWQPAIHRSPAGFDGPRAFTILSFE